MSKRQQQKEDRKAECEREIEEKAQKAQRRRMKAINLKTLENIPIRVCNRCGNLCVTPSCPTCYLGNVLLDKGVLEEPLYKSKEEADGKEN